MSDRFVILSGCSGGGKSMLLEELGARGHATVAEPGRRIVREEIASGGHALPWIDPEAFARRAIAMALADRDAKAGAKGWVFFDRGLVDAAAALSAVTGQPLPEVLSNQRYHRRVFLTPPWREIYASDPERRHGWQAAVAEYERLAAIYPALGYDVFVLPRIPVTARADIVLENLADAGDHRDAM